MLRHRRGAALSVAIGLDGVTRYIVAQGPSDRPSLFRIDALTGTIQWRMRPAGDLPGAPALVGDAVAVNGQGGRALFGVGVDVGQ